VKGRYNQYRTQEFQGILEFKDTCRKRRSNRHDGWQMM